MFPDYQSDIDAVACIPAVPTILEVVCRTTGMGFAAVARVTEERWIACAVRDTIQFGLEPGGELQVDTTICHEIRASQTPVVINHVAVDKQFCLHPTPALYGFQSYISMPILLPGGAFFGTLCAIDPAPAKLDNPETIGMFKLFAELIGYHLDAHMREAANAADLAETMSALDEARSTAALREQFVAILGHDLRNPITAIQSGLRLLQKADLDARGTTVLGMMQKSTVRMAELVSNMLDFARVRLGGGIGLSRTADAPLAESLGQVLGELRAIWPERTIETQFAFDEPVDCDPDRIAQLCSNLLSNALTHGADSRPIRLAARSGGGMFELSVANAGAPISPAAIADLFKPFSRGKRQPNQAGLGLGLHIASEIAQAHGGKMIVASDPAETRFTFRMPVHAAD